MVPPDIDAIVTLVELGNKLINMGHPSYLMNGAALTPTASFL
jgi:hypothetical protein